MIDLAAPIVQPCELRLTELAELLAKREALRLLHGYMQQFADHPNFCFWLSSIERNGTILSRRIELTVHRLYLGV
jgi:hypothetical protein